MKVVKIPKYSTGVAAGFPSPADDFIEGHIDLNEHLILHPNASFLARAQGDSMVGCGIFDGDTLIVDRSVQAKHGDIVIAAIDGDLTCKTLNTNCLRQSIQICSRLSSMKAASW